MESENNMTTQVFLLLDMTGSMQADKQATVDACNEFVEGLKADPHTRDFLFSLAVFNSNIGLERIVEGVPLDKAPRLDHEHYQPTGATPLYDTMWQSMDLMKAHQGQVLFIVQTDGEENSSKTTTRQQIVERVAEKTAAGWQFVYLGCDIDAMQQGGKLGIAAGNTMSYDRKHTGQAFTTLTDSAARYAAGGSKTGATFFKRRPSGKPRQGQTS
jgi:hypothetical protein